MDNVNKLTTGSKVETGSRLKIRTHTMFGTQHSWAVTMRNIFSEYIQMGHDPYIQSINGFFMTPKSWKPYLDKNIEDPDLDICYTAPLNFKTRFSKNAKIKAAIYNYETIPLPKFWKDEYKYVDYVLPSSNFSKEVFLDAGWPDDKCVVVPHGINLSEFDNKDKLKLRTNKSFRFLNVSINHYRKNIDLVLDAYYTAFSSKDDVSLVLKTVFSPPSSGKKVNRFECSVVSLIKKIQDKHLSLGKSPNDFPSIEIIEQRFPSMVPLYNSCDALVSASSSEGFGLPLLEGLASGLIVIAPRATGQLDFLNDKNSLLVDVDVVKADSRYQYWTVTDKSWTYMPRLKSLSMNMRNAFDNKNLLSKDFKKESERVSKEFTWENAAKKTLELL